MATTNDFLPFAVGAGANVLSQSDYAAMAALTSGFQAGTAVSSQLNKVWRQSSIMSAVLAQFIVNNSGQSATDDGTTATLLANFTGAIRALTRQQVVLADTGAANAYTAVNATPLVAGTWIDGVVQAVKISHANTGASTYAPDGLTAIPIYGLGLQPLQGGELFLNGTAILMRATIPGVNSGNPICVLMECAGGAQQVAPATQSQHAVQLGQTNSLIATSRVPVRQTVLTGVADANGYAAFLQIGTGLAVNLLATASPLVLAFAAGFGANGEADYVGQITADVASAWSGLPANTTSYLYVDRNPTTSVLTYGASSLTPAYQDAAPGSPATDQHWFSPLTMVMQRWSGSAWVAVQRVFVGRAVAGTSTITAVTVYAFKGKYLSQLNALPSGSSFTATHALGVYPRHFEIFLVNITSELGYSVGSRVPLPYVDNGTATISATSDTLNGTVSATPAGIALAFVNTGVRSAITAANWNIQFAVDRGW